MLNKTDVIAELVQAKLPLFTTEIKKALATISQGPPNLSQEAVLELIKRYPDHFSDYIYRKTKFHKIEGGIVWTSPETNRTFHDVDIEIVRRYMDTAYAFEDYLSNMPRSMLLLKMERHAETKRQRDIELGEIEDEERYFSLPTAYASDECWLHWGNLPHLTSDECAALAMGLDPSLVSLSKVEAVVGNGKSRFLDDFRKVKRIIERGFGTKDPESATISFQKFKELLNKNQISPSSPAMARALGSMTSQVDHGHVSTPAVHSLYRIALALAVKQYPEFLRQMEAAAYAQPQEKATPSVFTQMEKELKTIIPTISDGNLKKYLQRAYSYARNENLIARDLKTD